ncbi:GNAT family N-acetyltransferase [Fodinicurvata sediminis]|uniref:GNAT family N-acetyltransferase n=1 Tax=Fodinicurvata sediminis TaxID=1121832 RepID=UPI0003B37B9B|nr:GNAT family N-acetyltransferase [Fodinicurvata sediminis]
MDRIRPANLSDLAAIERLVEAAYGHYVARIGKPPGPMLDDYAAHIAAGRLHLLFQENTLFGLVVLIENADHMLLDNVAVHPEAQGQGLGRRLIAFAEEHTRQVGYERLLLYTHEAMIENLALYQHLGFREIRRVEEKGYRRVYMEKMLA